MFLAMTRNADDPTRAALARKVTINSFILLMASVFIGTYVLEFFGLSIPVVQIGGGLVVCAVAWDLLRGADVSAKFGNEGLPDPDVVATEAFYPLTLALDSRTRFDLGGDHHWCQPPADGALVRYRRDVFFTRGHSHLRFGLLLLPVCRTLVEIVGERRHLRRGSIVGIHPPMHRRADHVERHRRTDRDHGTGTRSTTVTDTWQRTPRSAIMLGFAQSAWTSRQLQTNAGVAQLVEQRIRNAKVGSSTLFAGTRNLMARTRGPFYFPLGCRSSAGCRDRVN